MVCKLFSEFANYGTSCKQDNMRKLMLPRKRRVERERQHHAWMRWLRPQTQWLTHRNIIAVLAIVFARCELFANCSSSCCYDCWPFKAISWHSSLLWHL